MIKTIFGAVICIHDGLKLKALEYFEFEKELINIKLCCKGVLIWVIAQNRIINIDYCLYYL